MELASGMVRRARKEQIVRWLDLDDPAVRAFVLQPRDEVSRRRHRMRARRLPLERLRKALRDAEARGVNVEAIRANVARSIALIIEECDRELAEQDLGTRAARRKRGKS